MILPLHLVVHVNNLRIDGLHIRQNKMSWKLSYHIGRHCERLQTQSIQSLHVFSMQTIVVCVVHDRRMETSALGDVTILTRFWGWLRLAQRLNTSG